MLLLLLLCYLSLSARGQQAEDEWLDPYDMLNYDSSTKTMRNPPECLACGCVASQPTTFTNVATKRREYVQDQNQGELTSCNQQVKDLQRQVEDQQKSMTLMSQQPTCNPVFKRFLSRLPSDSSDVFYDAKVKLSKQAMTEIQSLLEGEDRWRTGALDNAISEILVDFKPHDYEAWKWRFEDTFHVELDTVVMYGGVHAAFQHGIMAPFRRPRRDPPAPELEHLQRFHPRIEARDYFAGGDAPAHAPMLANGQQHVSWHQGDNARLDGNNIHRRRPNRVREDSAPVGVETLRAADPLVSEDELDGEQHEESPEVVENAPVDQQETPEKVEGENASADQPKIQKTKSHLSQAKKKEIQTKEEGSQDEPSRDGTAAPPQPTEMQRSEADVQDPEASVEEPTASISLRCIETVGVPVQETGSAAVE
ncbi:hypothetical protein XENOCAPTIV_020263 [Xenoophorus captivus]|uniref:Chloride channel CLIC-like protein 1 n=1 Tax=Xenoophorus captivus TaxID=1517983 RepID=A0ABV0Q674_9TELE